MRTGPLLCSIAGALAACGVLARPAPEGGFEAEALPFFARHCVACHGPQKQRGGFRIDTLARDFPAGSTERWREVLTRIKSGDMPPRDAPPPDEATRIVDWLTQRLERAESARLARRGPVAYHRLTRVEYANTIRDLLGVDFDPSGADALLPDDTWRGFERIGPALSLAPAHVERYLAAAERVLAEALPDAPPRRAQARLSAVGLVGGEATLGAARHKALRRAGLDRRVRCDLWPGQSVRVSTAAATGQPGRYRFRVRASGLPAHDGRRPHLVLTATGGERLVFERDVVTPEDAPVVLEFEAHLQAGEQELSFANEVAGPPLLARLGRAGQAPFLSLAEGRIPWQIELVDDAGRLQHPLLLVDEVEIDGPLPAPVVAADLARFAERAFRRPLAEGELDRYTALVVRVVERGGSGRAALRVAMQAILCSPAFLFLVEGAPGRATLDDWQVAARLSYFLWSTMPDAELLALARAGRLQDEAVLRAQADRMLADDRAVAFVREFTRQWLELDRVGMFPPDVDLYPEYDGHLQRSMVAETTAFFGRVLREDLSLRELLVSDWTVVNPRLARHYGIAGVDRGGFEVVRLAPGHHRGGILTHASVLSLTSDGVRHRPVHRGVWLSKAILGRIPPSPPPAVEPIEPLGADVAKMRFRDQLQRHRASPACAGCHARIDPLGLAFDHYDAIGRWRAREHVPAGTGEDPPVDASGALPGGGRFADARGLLALLVADIDTFHGAFVEKLATFALRRPMARGDRAALAAIIETSKADDYRLRDLVTALVTSRLFRGR